MDGFTIPTYQIVLYIVVGVILLTACTVLVTSAQEATRRFWNPKTEYPHGSREKCEECPAWIYAVRESNKIEVRLAEGDKRFIIVESKIDTIDKNVSDLASTVKKWQDKEVKELREALKEKDRRIKELENKESV